MNSKNFLLYGGSLLLLLALLGVVGVLGPTPERSVLGQSLWFDGPQNWLHLILGLVAVGGAFVLDAGMRRNLTLLYAVVALVFALYGFFSDALLLGGHLETLDNVLHLVLAAWGFWAGMNKEAA